MNAPPPGTPTSTMSVPAPMGPANFTMKTFDQTGGGGTLLGQVNVGALITLGHANVLDMAVEGIVSSVSMTPLPNQPMLQGDASTGYTLLGNWGAEFNIVLKDPDGNILLTDAPPITVQNAPGIYGVMDPADASDLHVQPVGLTPGFVQATFVFNNADGTTFSAPPVKMRSLSVVEIADAGSPGIHAFTEDGAPVILPPGSFAGLSRPTALDYDYCRKTLAVADGALNDVLLFGLQGVRYPYAVGPFSGEADPVGMVLNVLDDGYFMANAGDNTIRGYRVFGPAFDPISTGTIQPSALTCLNSCIDFLIASASSNSVVEYGGSTQVSTAGKFLGLNLPSAIIASDNVDPVDPHIFVSNKGNSTISVFDTAGNPATLSGSFPGLSSPTAMSFGTHGIILVTNAGNNTVSEFDINGDPIPLSAGAFPGLDQPTAIFSVVPAICYG